MPATCDLRIVFLGSGSAGNASVVTDGTTTLLIDCGFSARETSRRLEIAGIDPSSVTALLVTHEHSDHVCGIPVFTKRRGSTVYATQGTCRAARFDALPTEVRTLTPGSEISIGTLRVLPFKVAHDSAEPVGFRIESRSGYRFGMMTDTGVLTPDAAEALADVDLLGLECNHDLRMLAEGPYPYHVKRRIRSGVGHLSNDAAADTLERLASDQLKRVCALHRSQTNNTASLAKDTLVARARALGLGVRIDLARQDALLDCAPPQSALF
ncbi:MAG: MBL fold metallo-hydrolase [Coriobacteriia bacterium]